MTEQDNALALEYIDVQYPWETTWPDKRKLCVRYEINLEVRTEKGFCWEKASKYNKMESPRTIRKPTTH